MLRLIIGTFLVLCISSSAFSKSIPTFEDSNSSSSILIYNENYNSIDTLRKRSANRWRFIITLPLLNNHVINPGNQKVFSTLGSLGFGAAIEYHYQPKKYYSISGVQFINILNLTTKIGSELLPVEELWAKATSVNFSFSHNHIVNKFHFGYGGSVSLYAWNISRTDSRFIALPTGENYTAGLHAKLEYNFWRNCAVRAIYLPSFNTLDAVSEFKYQHYVSVMLAVRFM